MAIECPVASIFMGWVILYDPCCKMTVPLRPAAKLIVEPALAGRSARAMAWRRSTPEGGLRASDKLVTVMTAGASRFSSISSLGRVVQALRRCLGERLPRPEPWVFESVNNCHI